MKTRIDIFYGYPGSGKSTLIRQIAALSADCGRVIHFDADSGLASVTAARLARLIRRDRPNRILLESPAKPDVWNQLFARDELTSQAYAGTQALVIDGACFLSGEATAHKYADVHISTADIVFVSRAEALSTSDRLAILTRVWELNRHVNVAVEPYHGIDLWKMLDLPSAGRCEENLPREKRREVL